MKLVESTKKSISNKEKSTFVRIFCRWKPKRAVDDGLVTRKRCQNLSTLQKPKQKIIIILITRVHWSGKRNIKRSEPWGKRFRRRFEHRRRSGQRGPKIRCSPLGCNQLRWTTSPPPHCRRRSTTPPSPPLGGSEETIARRRGRQAFKPSPDGIHSRGIYRVNLTRERCLRYSVVRHSELNWPEEARSSDGSVHCRHRIQVFISST